jgi:hypothetical protein
MLGSSKFDQIKALHSMNMNSASPASPGSPLSPHSPCAFATTTEARFADFKACQATPSSSVSSPVCGDFQMAFVNRSKRVRGIKNEMDLESSSVAKRPARKKRKGVLHVSSAARQPTLEDNIYVHLSHEVFSFSARLSKFDKCTCHGCEGAKFFSRFMTHAH